MSPGPARARAHLGERGREKREGTPRSGQKRPDRCRAHCISLKDLCGEGEELHVPIGIAGCKGSDGEECKQKWCRHSLGN